MKLIMAVMLSTLLGCASESSIETTPIDNTQTSPLDDEVDAGAEE